MVAELPKKEAAAGHDRGGMGGMGLQDRLHQALPRKGPRKRAFSLCE